MNPPFSAILPFILLWIPSTLFFLMMVRRNKKITHQARVFWSLIIMITWFQGAIIYAVWGLTVQIWDDLFKEKSSSLTS